MAKMSFRLTNEKPAVLIGGSSLIFESLFIPKANTDIENVEFELRWEEINSDMPKANPVRHTKPFIPFNWINPFSPESKTNFDFAPPPICNFEKNLEGVTLKAFSKDGKPFYLDIHIVLNHH
jgi:hypothetical protein